MADLGAEPRLVVPEGLMIDESARERLVRRLAAAPETVVGVAGETSDLAPGASYRVHAEWKSLEPWRPAARSASNPLRGAVLLRTGTAFAVRDGCVEINPGEIADASVLVDSGAHVHDPHAAAGPVQDASELGRPPFPRRPVVVFLACEGGADTDWVRRLVNRLVRRDIEARLAVVDAPSGLHLTRPCLPTPASIRALAPDVVVTLDPTAAAHVEAWCEGNRSTVVVAFDPELLEPMELVSWQIGRARGRLRARIGPHVDVPAFAALVIRLGAGPQPIPPSDEKILADARRPVRERWTTVTASEAAPTCVVLHGTLDAAATARVDGSVDNLAVSGASVVLAPLAGGVPAAAREAAVVMLAGVAPTGEIDALIAERRRTDLPTVVDLSDGDLLPGEPQLDSGVMALALACGHVTAPAGALHAAARTLGVRTIVVPTLFTREFGAALRATQRPIDRDPTAPLVIGWDPGPLGPAYGRAVAAGIELALVHDTNAVELVGDPASLPDNLVGHERVKIVPGFDLEVVRRWAVHAWTPALAGGAIAGDTRPFELVSCLGVPSVMPAAASSAVDGLVPPYLLVHAVDVPQEWADSLHHVLDDAATRARRAREALRRADALDSAATASTVVSRFLGWATYRIDELEPVHA